MKKLIALFCVASAVTAFADTPAASDNVFGVLRVDIGDVEEAIIAVPWLDPGTGNDINVTDVIKTANLNEGDQLYYYNTQSGKYQVWRLKNDKTWESSNILSDDKFEEASSTGKTLARGDAILLKRSGTGTRATSVYLYGQVPTTSETTIQMAVGTSAAPAYTLLAPPTTAETSPSAGEWNNVGVNDWIIIAGKAPLNYNTTDKKWGRMTVAPKTFVVTWNYDDIEIPAGQGVWFISRSGTNASVKWSSLPSVK